MKKIIAVLILLASPVSAQSPTIVYGASENAPGHPDQYLIIQPENAPNPLGNPIVLKSYYPQQTAQPAAVSIPTRGTTVAPSAVPSAITQEASQNPAPFSESPRQQDNQIENTLYQGGNRIYDIQSYPLKDIKTITEPNIQPTITTYPEY